MAGDRLRFPQGGIEASGNLTEHLLAVADVVAEMAAELGAELGAEPAQVALARTLTNPAVASPVIGARTLAQAERNLICWVGSGACPSGGCSRR